MSYQQPPPQGYYPQQQPGYGQPPPPPQPGYYQQPNYYQPSPAPQTVIVQQQPQRQNDDFCCAFVVEPFFSFQKLVAVRVCFAVVVWKNAYNPRLPLLNNCPSSRKT
ncbi:hypothetical protein DM01DRAFT_13951 [Hesseltinella vesiculosa]|uniref:Cysteine-rich transmembrane CYSTM domain-containing protein n=1 Tax=Hesseltinella vesiculosa TaxID=101127 RepID=A0A1X2GJA3_9FUNG|nr:hypothetical protein DM01DRAFT_13951 [Hesseltinella vesiculosa]